MVYCCAVDCTNGSGSGKTFHRFPRDSKLKQLWIARVKRKNWSPTQTTVLCSDHFQRADYETDPELLKTLGVKRQLRLRDGVVPSLFIYNETPTKKRRSLPEKRRRKQVNKTFNVDDNIV